MIFKGEDYYQVDVWDEVVRNFINNRLSLGNHILKKNYYYGDTDEDEYDIYLDGHIIGQFASGFDEPGITIRDVEAIDQFLLELNTLKPIENYHPDTRMYLKVHNIMYYLYDSDYFLKRHLK